jgi:glycosyltransferase involved in cell wall biosynthesis
LHRFQASLTPEKGIDVLLNAISRIRKSDETAGIPFKVLIIGDGPERERLETIVQNLNLDGCVEMLGHRSDARVLLKIVDIFVLPSRNEGLPIALLEAMASNCGLVATNVGEVASVITRQEQGLLVDADDVEGISRAISEFLKDPDKLSSAKRHSYYRVKDAFSSTDMARQYCEVYAEVIRKWKTI